MREYILEKHFNLASLALGVLLGGILIFAENANSITFSIPELPIQPSEVTSAMILDGAIVNADVSSTAAIAPTKIATTSALYFVTDGAQTVAGVKTFSSIPATTGGNCASGNDLCNKTYVDSAGGSLTITAYTREAVTSSMAMRVLLDYSFQVASNTYQGVGTALDDAQFSQRQAQSFSLATTSTISQVSIQAILSTLPTDTMIVSIQNNSGTVPSNIDIVSSTVDYTNILGTATLTPFVFNTTTTLNASTTYWITARRSGADSDLHYYSWQGSTSTVDLYPHGQVASYDGTVWTAGGKVTRDLTFNFNLDYNVVAVASAAASTTADGFIGFNTATTTANGTASITLAGNLTNQSNLRPAWPYYLQNAAGTIGLTAGTVSRIVGVAINSSTLQLKNF